MSTSGTCCKHGPMIGRIGSSKSGLAGILFCPEKICETRFFDLIEYKKKEESK